jgi:inner membrane protein
LNTYGIRLLMPFSGEWFYGDALFIVDPWVWLLAGAAVVLAHTRSRVGIGVWLALGVLLTALVTSFPGVPPVARLLWLLGVVTIGAVRHRAGAAPPPRVAEICLVVMLLYIVVMVTSAALTERVVRGWLAERDDTPIEIMAGPQPATPFVRNIIVVDDGHYHFLELDWLAAERIRVASPAIERGPRGPVVEAALAAPHVRGLATWVRFPVFDVETLADGYRVTMTDVRYGRAGGGLGGAVVELDRQLRVRSD